MGMICSKPQIVHPAIPEPVDSRKSSRQSQTAILQNKIQLYNSLKKIDEYQGRRKRQFIFA